MKKYFTDLDQLQFLWNASIIVPNGSIFHGNLWWRINSISKKKFFSNGKFIYGLYNLLISINYFPQINSFIKYLFILRKLDWMILSLLSKTKNPYTPVHTDDYQHIIHVNSMMGMTKPVLTKIKIYKSIYNTGMNHHNILEFDINMYHLV